MRVLSWNLLRTEGATIAEVRQLIERHRPDLFLMQEVTAPIDALPGLVGGHYVRQPMAGRNNGPAAWSPNPFEAATVTLPLATRYDLPVPIFRRVSTRLALVVQTGGLAVANVHLDHGQRANRRQLRHLLQVHPDLTMIAGDYNALGTTSLPGFTDVGPRRRTHRAYGLVPLRLDRCLVRGLRRTHAAALDYGGSDHRPILVDLDPVRNEAA